MPTASRTSAWQAFMDLIHNYPTAGGPSYGDPQYYTGAYPHASEAAGPSPAPYGKFAAKPTPPPANFAVGGVNGITPGTVLAATVFVNNIFVFYATSYTRVRTVTHRRFHNGALNLTKVGLTALDPAQFPPPGTTSASMTAASTAAGVTKGHPISLGSEGAGDGVRGFARRLRQVLEALPAITIDYYYTYCHGSCHGSHKGRSRR